MLQHSLHLMIHLKYLKTNTENKPFQCDNLNYPVCTTRGSILGRHQCLLPELMPQLLKIIHRICNELFNEGTIFSY